MYDPSNVKTVVYQSYRTHDVPSWISRCMASVEEWAAQTGADYRFLDDSFLEYAPEWYREKTENDIYLVSDLARLKVAGALLAEGYERTIWVDADVLVFDPASFTVDIGEGYVFCRQVWVARATWRKRLVRTLSDRRPYIANCHHGVNNSVTAFARGNEALDFFIDACEFIVRRARGPISSLSVGTKFLTDFHKLCDLPLLENVGLFSPLVMRDIAAGGGPYAKAFAREFASDVAAANLCGSTADASVDGVVVDSQTYTRVVDELLADRGGLFNRCVKPG